MECWFKERIPHSNMESKWICENCSRKFSTSSNLYKHQRSTRCKTKVTLDTILDERVINSAKFLMEQNPQGDKTLVLNFLQKFYTEKQHRVICQNEECKKTASYDSLMCKKHMEVKIVS